MRLKLLMLLTLFACMPAIAQRAGIQGVIVDDESGSPVVGATVLLDNQGNSSVTGTDGLFRITDAKPGNDNVTVLCLGYGDWSRPVTITAGKITDLGIVKLKSEGYEGYSQNADLFIDESQLEDEEGNSQTIGTLAGASDNVFYNAASYDFSVMRFRQRGYDQNLTEVYINGVNFNEPARGRFNYSMFGGLNQAFKNKVTGIGLEATSFGIAPVGGASNVNTQAKDYAPGFRGNLAYTNSNYYMRAMAMYSTGLNRHGWALTLGAITRYSDKGVQDGTFYNSWGYFLSLQKVFNEQHSISLTTFGAPTKRANNNAVFEEACVLADNYLYNSAWGWQNGEQRSAKVVESFDPTAIINWIWKPKHNTTVNTGVGFRKSFYASSALIWYNAADPRPDYYRYLPSFYDDESTKAFYTDLWQNNEDFRQINWNKLYYTNYLNNEEGKGATYILENRHSNQLNLQFNSTVNAMLTDKIKLHAGVGANYTQASYYKTIKDLLGGSYWTDIDQFSERDYPENPLLLQNDLNNPSRRVGENDRFGYDYNVNSYSVNAWVQNIINLRHWDINYGMKLSYTQFQRDGKMRNGRAPENSYGKGKIHRFDNGMLKVGLTYKLDGRNSFVFHGSYGTMAPIFDQAYVSPRIKDDVITGLKSGRILSGDISYVFNYRRVKGSITGFWTNMYDMTERTSFYDDQYSTFMNYVLTDVNRTYKGVEAGVAVKVLPSVTVSAAGTYSRYQYKNRPTGTRSYENGMAADVTQVVYLENYYVGGTPQQAYNLGIDWAAPHNWYFNVNGSWMGDSYVSLSPIRHEAMPELWTICSSEEEMNAKIDEITRQDKLNDAFVLNASIGKVVYVDRKVSLNFNLNVNNVLNNRKIQTGGYQQGRFDYTNYTTTKFPNKYYYAQGIKVYFNVGIKF